MKITIIGGGNMGLAIVNGIARAHAVTVCEKDPKRADWLRAKYKVAVKELADAVSSSEAIIVAVKPQDIEIVLEDIREHFGRSTLVISIAAGITLRFLEKRLGPMARVVRAMPNMPAQIGEGLTALSRGKNATAQDLQTSQDIFNHVGKTVVIKEDLMDAVTAVSGSGPAYVFLFAECLAAAARKIGLEKTMAQELVEATITGSAHQLIRLGEDPASLRAKVTSRGGTTQAAIAVFEKHKIADIFVEALAAAKKRSKELARE